MVTQVKRNAAEYALEFCTLPVGSGWNKPVLKAIFHQGLNPEVLTELTCRDDKASLDSLIDLAIHLDHLICNCQAYW